MGWTERRKTVNKLTGFLTVALGVLGLGASGCDCSDATTAVIVISSPVDGARLTLSDDEEPAVRGVQFTVRALTSGIAQDEEVGLYLDANAADTAPADYTAFPDASGEVVFPFVTFPAGEHRIQVRARMGGVRSNIHQVTVSEACASITFVAPEPPSGTDQLTLGPDDDTDGEACGAQFQTTVVVSTDAGDGQTAQLFVNNTPRETVAIQDTVARFRDVALDNRGDVPNLLAVEVINQEGITCREEFPADVLADCAGPSCAITEPDSSSAFLNRADDVSAAAGFQTDVRVTTDVAGEPVALILDGDEGGALQEVAQPAGTAAVASFGNLTLSEGAHQVQAECRDDSGNVTRSGVAQWTVDTTPCDIQITSPSGGRVFIPDDDVNTSEPGVQVALTASVSGDACVAGRAGPCSALPSSFMPISSTTFETEVTLSSSADQQHCAQVQDQAGNVTGAEVAIQLRSDLPQVEIVEPATGTSYNNQGDGSRVADLEPSTPACQAGFVVHCSDPGSPVTLWRQGGTQPLTGGTATCEAEAGLEPFSGRATFAEVSLPNVPDGGPFNIFARHEVNGLVGTSDAISLTADCEVPEFSVLIPECGSLLRPSTDDQDTSEPGFQHNVELLNTNDPPPVVDLEIRNGSTIVYQRTSTRVAGIRNVFVDADFGAGGTLQIEGCGTDPYGNRGCTEPCEVTVADLPTVAFVTPQNEQVLSSADDCSGDAGFQMPVQVTTDAAAGSSASVTVGSLAPVTATVQDASTSSMFSENFVDVCTDASEGQQIAEVTITDSRGSATGSVEVVVDTRAPVTAISDLEVSSVVSRRGGRVEMTWTAVADDGGGDLIAYELRCGEAAITTEQEWTDAQVVPTMVTPGTAGTEQSEIVSGFLPDVPRFCTLRAADAAGSLTPLGNSAEVSLYFMMVEVNPTLAGLTMGVSMAPVGDVNGDGVDDLLIGGDGAAYLYFGTTATLPTTPQVSLEGSASHNFGWDVAGIGDFNGDSIVDMAVGAFAFDNNKGRVYVLYGRASSTPWPSSLDTTACGADICFSHAQTTLFGLSVTGAGDFDGDGNHDLIVGAPIESSFSGRAYILLGRDNYPKDAVVPVPGTSSTGPDGFVVVAPGDPTTVRQFGYATAPLGDYDRDRRSDLSITAPGWSSNPAVTGRAYTLLGRAYGSTATGLVTVPSSALGGLGDGGVATYGITAASAGDYDSDGHLDVMIGDTRGGGKAHLFFGARTGFTTTRKIIIDNDLSADADDGFANALASGYVPGLGKISDLDQDDFSDLFIGSRQRSSDPGAADLFYSRETREVFNRSAADAWYQPASATVPANRVTQMAGDLNNDGWPDMAIGDPAHDSNNGRVFILY